jgi:hypothetical protein
MKTSSSLAFVAALFLAACASADGQGAEATGTASTEVTATAEYIDIFDFANNHGGADPWTNAVQGLNNDFLNVCGDTFCGSDYSNLTPLAFDCSVSKSEGKIKACTYTFAGSYSIVTGSTGKLTVTSKTFQCAVPVKGTVAQLITALTSTANEPLRNTLPGETSTVYDAIGGCLP